MSALLMRDEERTVTELTTDERLALDLERVVRELRRLERRAEGLTAARLEELTDQVLALAVELAPDVVTA